jgi:aspartate/tyrosine/aromatic aminotransferase
MALLTAAPYWGPYLTFAQEGGLRVETAPWLDYSDSPGLDTGAWTAKALELMRQQGRLMVWLNDPCHNPSGRTLPADCRRDLLEVLSRVADQGPVTLLLDFAYQDYTRDSAAARAAMDGYAALGAEGKVLVGASLSLSKSMTLYGSRGGALVFPWCDSGELQAALTMSCRGLFSNCPRAPQALLLRLARDGKAQVRVAEEQRHWSQVLEARAGALDAALMAEGLDGVPWDGGFFVTLRIASVMPTFERLKTQGVMVVPIPEGLRVGICGLRSADAPRFARSLKSALA